MALDVVVNIRLIKPAGKGLLIPLLYVFTEEAIEEPYKEYASLEEMTDDGYTTTDEVYTVANLIFMQDDAPDKIAILKAGKDEAVSDVLPKYLKNGWRQLVVLGEYDVNIATYIETTDKMYFTHFDDVDTLKAQTDDKTGTIGEFERTFAVVYESPVDKDGNKLVTYPEAAIVGATAGLKAGSCTYKNMILKGVPAMEYTDDEINQIHKAGGNTIVEKVGDIVTSEGKVVSGEYADIVDSKDFIVQKITYNTQKTFNNNKKVPYTNSGIAMLEAATVDALLEAYNNGMIADKDDGSPDYEVNFVKRNQTKDTDRFVRDYPYGKFKFVLAGAIHKATINGEIYV